MCVCVCVCVCVCMCVCVCVCVCLCVYALRIMSRDRILRVKNTLIIIILNDYKPFKH